jgi:hypothetical protein
MNGKRSMWKLFVGVATVSFLVNCTIKTEDDDGKAGASNNGTAGTGNTSSAGTSSSGASPGGSNNGGATSAAGAAGEAGEAGALVSAGSAGVGAGEAGAGGESGLVIDPTDCSSCLTQLCSDEYDACAADNETTTVDPSGAYCLSQGDKAAPGQFELILDCITTERAKGLVKRDVVRACGSSIGQSASPSFFVWAPVGMTPATENLINCMADAPDETMPGDWATDTATNYPASGPRPWDDMTCAKLACTSKLP